jgi:hypothetical protein
MSRHVALVVLSGMLTVSSSLSSAQVAPLLTSLHGESERPDQSVRRQEALKTAQQINTAEQSNIARGLRIYRAFDRLGVPGPPAGFQLQMNVGETSYMFSLKDTIDPCGFAIFSDQSERIYATTPQPRIQILRTQAR